MNERIQKLAAQAMESTGVEGLGGGYRELNPEKFAKLIIQECCDILAPYNIKNGVLFDISTNLPPIYVIKKHFGVEE